MASDIEVLSLTAVGGLGQITLTAVPQLPLGMACLNYMQPASVQFWAAAINNRNNAIQIATSDVGIAVHGGLSDSVTRYYWARAVDPEGNVGAFYPSSATGGVPATTKTTTPGPNSITGEMLQDGTLEKRVFVPGITPVEIVFSLPSTGNYVGRMVYLISAGKLYRHTGSPTNAAGFTAAVDGGDITANTLHGNTIIAGTVSAAALSVTQLSAINANLGAVTAGTVTGVTFTGNTFRTAATGRRIEVNAADNYIRVYNASGTLVATLGEIGTLDALLSVSRSTTGDNVNISNTNAGGTAARITGRVLISVPGGSSFNAPLLDASNPYATSTAHGVRGRNIGSGGGEGYLGLSGPAGGYAVFAATGPYGPFTGAHPGLMVKADEAVPGDILVDVKVLGRKGVDDTVTEVARSSIAAQRSVIGVLSSRRPFDPDSFLNPFCQSEHDAEPSFVRRHFAKKYDLATINGVGEGQINVCGLGGDIEHGDLITASDMPGKGQRQPDDIVRSYTVARARESVTFDHHDQIKMISCIYVSG